jgi:hypothetical protein
MHITGPRNAMLDYQSLTDALFLYPSAGTHIGKGRHVSLSPVGGPGWTVHHDTVRQHPTKPGLYCHAAVDPDKPGQGYPHRLSEEQIAQLRTKLATAAPLDPDWTPPGLDVAE